MSLRVLTWNLLHGRDAPPDRSLHTWRSRLLRVSERNETHLQVNRDLLKEFTAVLSNAEWSIALLQECPRRWIGPLASGCGAEVHASLTSRNSLAPLRSLLARLNPDLVASAEGGSNLTLVRAGGGSDPGSPMPPGHSQIAERRELVLTRRPERRTMAFTRLGCGICVANLHASNAAPELVSDEVLTAADRAIDWSRESPLIFGGDFNLRPDRAPESFEALGRRGLGIPTGESAIDHVLVHRLELTATPIAWPADRREIREEGLAIRLSDHAPVEITFADPSSDPVPSAPVA